MNNNQTTDRPELHFTPQAGWMNDPNGLIFAGGVYHLFYQHFPHGTKWGPMHWGHATSRDLLHWQHQPIALYPTEDEYIFSGSAILDEKNAAGFATAGSGKPPMILFYTSHNPKTGEQTQSLAYSLDYANFTKYPGNPIIENFAAAPSYKKDFRDPKVFENPILGGWTMVLAAGDCVEFYHSANLLNWQFTGKYAMPLASQIASQNCNQIIFECPDCFCIDDKWFLSASIVLPGKTEETHAMQYVAGTFDGKTFTAQIENTEQTPKLLDHANQNYAAVTFANCSKTIMLGWGEDWNLARQNNAAAYFGKMTIAKELGAVKIEDQFFIKQTPFIQIEENEASPNLWEKHIIIEENRSFCAQGLKIENRGSCIIINEMQINRPIFDQTGKLKNCSNPDIFSNCNNNNCHVQIIFDHGYYEIFADGGLICCSFEA